MVDGRFGVFDGVDCLAEFSNDVDAEGFRADALELNIPEGFRRSAYDDLQVYEIMPGYDLWYRLYQGLKRSRNQDLAILRAIYRLRQAQSERRTVRHDT